MQGNHGQVRATGREHFAAAFAQHAQHRVVKGQSRAARWGDDAAGMTLMHGFHRAVGEEQMGCRTCCTAWISCWLVTEQRRAFAEGRELQLHVHIMPSIVVEEGRNPFPAVGQKRVQLPWHMIGLLQGFRYKSTDGWV